MVYNANIGESQRKMAGKKMDTFCFVNMMPTTLVICYFVNLLIG